MNWAEDSLRNLQKLIQSDRCKSYSDEKNIYIASFQDQTLTIQTILKETCALSVQTYNIPHTPHFMHETSQIIKCIEFFQLPIGLIDEPCLALGLKNGCFYLVTVSGLLLYVFCGFQSSKFMQLTEIMSITSNVQQKFISSFALCFRHSQGAAYLTPNALNTVIRAQTPISLDNAQNCVLQLNQTSLEIFGHLYSTSISLVQSTSLRIPPGLVFVENTALVLMGPRPFLTKAVPVADNRIGELTIPLTIQQQIAMLDPSEISDQSCVYQAGEEFDYFFTQNNGVVYCSSCYKGQWIVDVLDLAIGYLGGDYVDFESTGKINVEQDSDMDLKFGKNAEKQMAKIDTKKIARNSYKIAHCQYVVQNLPHMIALAADGGLLIVRVDLLDVIAVDYHLNYSRDNTYQLFTRNEIIEQKQADFLYVVESGQNVKLWKFELPSLVFKGVEDVEGKLYVLGNEVLKIDGQLVEIRKI
ncbi:Conserved_hypothetical protein [Hexamita inflata]|uniref:Uncharacterized protein n=1 Tax=Hexamita inflata TaxID=28002 RepID=A0AA86R1T5_9EUKA|nr:Conserved hypothetical protein [Hexamita inflata]